MVSLASTHSIPLRNVILQVILPLTTIRKSYQTFKLVNISRERRQKATLEFTRIESERFRKRPERTRLMRLAVVTHMLGSVSATPLPSAAQ